MTESTYTVFIRVPIPRGDFIDPPSVNWDVAKDDALWHIVSKAQNEIDWNDLATRFNATVPFLLQQASYLTERHASQVRAQLRKAAKGTSTAPSPIPGGEPGGHQRTASALSLRRDSPMPARHDSGSGTPISTMRPNISRNPSGTTLTAVAIHNNNNSLASAGPCTPSRIKAPPFLHRATDAQSARKRLPSLPISTSADPPSPGSPDSPAASSDDGSSESSSPAQSRIIRRPPRFQQQHQQSNDSFLDGYDDDDDDDDDGDDDDDDTGPAFHYNPKPLTQQHRQPSAQDLAATLREDPRELAKKRSSITTAHQSQTSDSSIGSLSMVSRVTTQQGKRRTAANAGAGPLSPRRPNESSARSTGGAAKGKSREGSEGAPSMSSSYSDLDDASVTQSALEEAYLSKLQDGAASRFSIGALRSRYGPKPS